MNQRKITLGMLVTALLLLPACGPNSGFQSSAPEQSTSSSSNSTSDIPVEQLSMKAYVSGGIEDGEQVFEIDPINHEVVIKIPIPNLELGLAETPISQLPGARLSTWENAEGKNYLLVTIPLSAILRDVSSLPVGKLPNGRALPQIPGGEPPVMAFTVAKGNKNIHVYVGMDSAAVFIESSSAPRLGLSYKIRSSEKDWVGTFAVIPAESNFLGGYFMGVRIPAGLARLLDQVIK